MTTNASFKDRYVLKGWDNGSNAYRQATAVYNALVAPSLGLNVAGLLWYQGEQDLGERKGTYTEELDVMYRQYCRLYGFEEGKMPFVMPILMPYMVQADPHTYGPFTAKVAEYGDKNAMITAVPMTDMSSEHDASNNASHPHEKKPVGERLAAATLSMVYGKTAYPSDAPIPASSTTSGNTCGFGAGCHWLRGWAPGLRASMTGRPPKRTAAPTGRAPS